MLLIDDFDRGLRLNPNGSCLFMADGSSHFSYREAADLTHRMAAAFARDGLMAGDRVGVLSPNHPLAFIAILAALRLNATWVPLNAKGVPAEVIHMIELTECKFLVYHPSVQGLLNEIAAAVPQALRCIAMEAGGRPGDPELDGWLAPEGTRVPAPEYEPERPALLIGTGGTTGKPKAVPVTHSMLEAMNLSMIGQMPEQEPPVVACATPMTHAGGIICFAVLMLGGKVVVHDGVKPGELLASIGKHRVTRLFLPPTAIYSLLAYPDVRKYDYSSLRHFIYAAAPMSVQKLREALEVFGPVMTQTYGQAEAPMVATIMTPAEHLEAVNDPSKSHRLASAGRPSLAADVAILDPEGREVPTGERGEICVRGALTMSGYYKNDEQSRATRRPGGWHGTSDVGYMDQDGYVYIVDRLRDMIITGGFNVWPGEIEQIIHGLEGVKDCAVIGLPDTKWGEAVTAVVELKGDCTLTEEAIISRCRDELGAVKTPKSVIFRDLPRSPVGKVLKRALRDEYWGKEARRV